MWNLAWGLTFFWDGRANSLEAQASGPIENAREMAGDLNLAAARLLADPDMARDFARTFPEDPAVSEDHIRKALAAYERTLVSPPTRFDRWVAGDEGALAADERAGFSLFVGKAGCVSCHSGWRFTDEAFHDIGLAQAAHDLGRAEVIGTPAANHAFKTPSLRERVWTGPYMHDGSLPSLDAVIDHYADGVVPRATLSPDLKRNLRLTPKERHDLVAFLATLSSDDPPRPSKMPGTVAESAAPAAVDASRIFETGRRFDPAAVAIRTGDSLAFINDDTRTHQVRIDDKRFSFASQAQEPGDTISLRFPIAGQFDVICGIHPEMRLSVDVRQKGAAKLGLAAPVP